MTYTKEEKRSRIRGIVGAASGNLVEWFDFYSDADFAAHFDSLNCIWTEMLDQSL